VEVGSDFESSPHNIPNILRRDIRESLSLDESDERFLCNLSQKS
jgi:hypothetical protein